MNNRHMMRQLLVMMTLPAVTRVLIGCTVVVSIFFVAGSASGADGEFERTVRPILRQYCVGCHSTELKEGELDLEPFVNSQSAVEQPQIWEHILTQLADGEMPPKDEPQLPDQLKAKLTTSLQQRLNQLALASAGDPGNVVLRRLSNMEYTYTLRDLTGIGSLDPAKEFPADGAAGEGFTNAGAALVMSPSFLTKYLDAAKSVADHAVLLPSGMRFSPSTSRRDWTNESLVRIRDFYRQFTVTHDEEVTVGGTGVVHNDGGRIPLEKYLAALSEHRDALAGGTMTIATVARDGHVNEKYLGLLWTMLHDEQPALLLDSLREKWRNNELAVADIEPWQNSLWRFTNIGHLGKAGGPKAWMEPVTPLASQQEFRVKLAAPAAGEDVVIYLSADDAGDGNEHDFALWENGRIVSEGRPDLPLKELSVTHAEESKFLYGIDPALFGKHPDGGDGDVTANSLCVRAPSLIEVRLPASLVDGAEFVVVGRLHPTSEGEGSVQMRVSNTKPTATQLRPSSRKSEDLDGAWTSSLPSMALDAPVLVHDGSAARQRFETAFDEFRQLFPAAVCYTTIVPVDEVVTLTLFHREDELLSKLMLDDQQHATLDRLWAELHFVSRDALTLVDAFEQIWEFSSQDGPDAPHGDKRLEPLREPIMQGAEQFRKQLVAVEPEQVQAVIDFAPQAWRRPLTGPEQKTLRDLYQTLRTKDVPHEESVRLVLARVLTSPAFLYRGETAGPGASSRRVSDWELATRLSYFLWSSPPDEELRAVAASGKLHNDEVLIAQTRRMLTDDKVRRLATEFGCQWLHIRDLETLDEKSERHFPTFVGLRGEMQEEAVRFLMDMFQADRSVLSLLSADHSFLNAALAEHYDIELPATEPHGEESSGDEWQRVDGMRARGRGGMLGFAATLSKQSGASRTSPILRGIWVSEVLLGEHLPPPPKDVPILPDEAPQGLTVRQLIQRHSSDLGCANCHKRFDHFGFALEGFDAIGRARSEDAGGLPIDTLAKVPGGGELHGMDGLRTYLLEQRRDDFVRQFCRKLLGYALGRSVQLSDQPLIDNILDELKLHDYRVSIAVERIVLSPQFREIRGREFDSNN